MNRHQQILHILLALMITISVVVLSGHNYSHAQSDITTCELCIHHGNSSSAILAEINAVFATQLPGTFIQIRHPSLPANTDFYHQPSRAPPRFT
jgi:hypothetical protein